MDILLDQKMNQLIGKINVRLPILKKNPALYTIDVNCTL